MGCGPYGLWHYFPKISEYNLSSLLEYKKILIHSVYGLKKKKKKRKNCPENPVELVITGVFMTCNYAVGPSAVML